MKELIFSILPKRFRTIETVGVFARGTGVALFIQIAGIGVGYTGQILLARWLGVNGYGIYTYLFTWIQVWTVGALLGMDLGVVRFIPGYIFRQDWGHLKGILLWSRGVVWAIGIILALASILSFFYLRPIQSSLPVILLGSLVIPFSAIASIQTEIIRSTKRIGWAYAPTILLQPLLILAVAYGFLRVLGGLADIHAIAALWLAICIVAVIQGGVIHRLFSGLTRDVRAAYPVREWLKVALPLLFNSVFVIILFRIDTLAVGLFLGSEEVAIYGAAVKTAAIVSIALVAANAIIAPLIASHYARHDMAGLQDIVSLATLGSFAASLFVSFGVMLFSGPLLGAFGVEFVRAQWPLLILIIGQLVNVGSGSVGLLLVLTGYEKQSMIVMGFCALLISALCFLIIPSFGIVGAAAASMLGISLWNLWLHQLVVKNLGIRPSVFFAMKKFFFVKDLSI